MDVNRGEGDRGTCPPPPPHKFSRGGSNIKCPGPTILGLYDYSLKWGPFFSCELSGTVWTYLLDCHRGWWCTRIPLPRVWKIDPKMLKKVKKCRSPPAHQLFQDLRDFRGWRRTNIKTMCPPPPPPHGLVQIDPMIPFAICVVQHLLYLGWVLIPSFSSSWLNITRVRQRVKRISFRK